MALRWGIVSAGKISNDFCCGISTLPQSDHQLVAVAARSLDAANEFAKLHEIPKAYGSYLELAKDPNVEAVYIGAINTAHFELGIMMLDHGKHILCEKPLCMNAKQAKKLLAHAKTKGLFFMEAIWSRFFPSYIYLRDRIAKGDLGEITEVNVEFGFELSEVDRVSQKALGGGTILDLGIYTIQVSQWAFRQSPSKIVASGTVNADGVDMEMKGELTYPSGGVARIHTSALETLKNTATIKGNKGSITLHDFWCPISLTDVDGQRKEFSLPKAKNPLKFKNSEGLRYEAEETRRCIRAGLLESESVTHVDSVLIAEIEDELRRQVGVRFPEDEQEF